MRAKFASAILVTALFGTLGCSAETNTPQAPAPEEVSALVYNGFQQGAQGAATTAPNLSLVLYLDDGSVTVDTPRCLVDGVGSYTMGADETWSFTPGELAEASCPNPDVQAEYDQLLTTLSDATAWEYTENSDTYYDKMYQIGTGALRIVLGLPKANSMRTLAPTPAPVDGTSADAVLGDWRVTSIVKQSTTPEPLGGPYDWDVVFDQNFVTLPKGCNTPAGNSYLATDDGRWYFGTDSAQTLIGCDAASVEQQSETLYQQLLAARNWKLADENTLVVYSTSSEITLVRQ